MSQTVLYLEGNYRVGVELRPEATQVLALPLLSGDKLRNLSGVSRDICWDGRQVFSIWSLFLCEMYIKSLSTQSV